eukprot:458704-Prorocentrum_minimum.AAC.8
MRAGLARALRVYRPLSDRLRAGGVTTLVRQATLVSASVHADGGPRARAGGRIARGGYLPTR